jgi:hypothetical protein
MSRFARLKAPALVHVISRFINREFRFEDDSQLCLAYLERVGIYVARTDWTWLGYGLMSSHTHNSLLCGDDPMEKWEMGKPPELVVCTTPESTTGSFWTSLRTTADQCRYGAGTRFTSHTLHPQ